MIRTVKHLSFEIRYFLIDIHRTTFPHFFVTLSTLLVNVFYVLNYQENFCTCRTFPHALYWTKRKNSSKNSKMCVDKDVTDLSESALENYTNTRIFYQRRFKSSGNLSVRRSC